MSVIDHFRFQALPVVVSLPWYCPEIDKTFAEGQFTTLPIAIYKRYRPLGDYFRRPMARCETPSGRVYWAATSRCGRLLVSPNWTVKITLPAEVDKPQPDLAEPAPWIPTAVKPCGCRQRK